MKNVKILDCTLRDGGYINNWTFGKDNIKKIINNLDAAKIDIVECGFLTNKVEYKDDASKFSSINQISEILPNQYLSLMVCMVNFGEYNFEELPQCTENGITGIRLAFHKKDLKEALNVCSIIKRKGYKLFMQPMVSLSYTDEEFLFLIRSANHLDPYAFYIVDSFGVMKQKDLIRLYYIVEHNLEEHINIGYHAHNNLQLAYSNAQALIEPQTGRKLIIDSSVFGMGRGAGNLNTELFVNYINEIEQNKYNTIPLLEIVDDILKQEYEAHPWGYSLPHYASAIHNCHPNYASWLDKKDTLTINNINEILSMIDIEKRISFDEDYIKGLYKNYLDKKIFDAKAIEILRNKFSGKDVILIAPGTSIIDEYEKIIEKQNEDNIISISVNFIPNNLEINIDYIFVSNIRRYNDLLLPDDIPVIMTSNLPPKNHSDSDIYMVNYGKLLNDLDSVRDNAAMLLIRLLIETNARKVYLAGLDGYVDQANRNYIFDVSISSDNRFQEKNKGISLLLEKFLNDIEIEFITNKKYIVIKNN